MRHIHYRDVALYAPQKDQCAQDTYIHVHEQPTEYSHVGLIHI